MVNTLVPIVVKFSKVIIFIIITLLIFSFTSIKWEEDTKSKIKIYNSIYDIFHSDRCTLESFNDNDFNIIKEEEKIIGYLLVTQSFSKTNTFDYYVLYNTQVEILKVEVLSYRESHGFEICNKRWLKQFIGINIGSEFEYNDKVDAISGATISVNSIKSSIFQNTQYLKKLIK